MSKKNFQFFTTDTDMDCSWFPMDHFFYGFRTRDEKGVVVHLEGHASISKPSGFSVSVVQGEGKKRKREEFDDYPSALRRMADIIEKHTKKENKKESK